MLRGGADRQTVRKQHFSFSYSQKTMAPFSKRERDGEFFKQEKIRQKMAEDEKELFAQVSLSYTALKTYYQ